MHGGKGGLLRVLNGRKDLANMESAMFVSIKYQEGNNLVVAVSCNDETLILDTSIEISDRRSEN